MPVKRRPAPLAPQRVIVQERGGPPGQGAAGAQQSLQQQALSSGPGTGYSAGPHAHKPFLQRQLSQRQFEIALTVLIAVGGITLMLIVLRLLGVI